MNTLSDDILMDISKNLCIYGYSNINKYMLINKSLSKYIKYYLDLFNNTDETILMATKIKSWISEVRQIDYIYDSFILFDNLKDYSKWKLNTKYTHTSSRSEHPKIIETSLYNIMINPLIYNSIESYKSYKYVTCDLDGDNKYRINKLKFDTYFIYYFPKDITTCYAINFLILPYYDSRIIQLKNFHSYNIIKANKVCNHNITKIHNIEF